MGHSRVKLLLITIGGHLVFYSFLEILICIGSCLLKRYMAAWEGDMIPVRE